MSRQSIFATLTAVLMLTAVAGCSRSTKPDLNGLEAWQEEAPEVLAASGDSATATPALTAPLTSQGFGPVRLGAEIEKLPQTLAGVYDSLAYALDDFDGQPYAVASGFLRGEHSLEVMAIEDATRIDAITVLTPGVTAAIAGQRLGVGDKAATLKGVSGMRYFSRSPVEGARYEYRDIRFYIEGDSVCAVAVGSIM